MVYLLGVMPFGGGHPMAVTPGDCVTLGPDSCSCLTSILATWHQVMCRKLSRFDRATSEGLSPYSAAPAFLATTAIWPSGSATRTATTW